MTKIIQYIPTFVERGDTPLERGEFNSLEELSAIPFVAGWMAMPDFTKFSYSGNSGITLIAEFRGGRKWWVVGWLNEVPSWLPEWDHGIYEIWDDGVATEVPGTEVFMSCGDDVTLNDGRIVKRRRE